MHQILLITALSATSGLFGGGRHCGAPRHCGRPTMGCYAPAYAHATVYAPSCAPCGGYAAPAYGYPAPAPQAGPAPAPQAAPPAPAPQAAYAPAVPQTAFYPAYYYPAGSACATGNCPRR